MEEQSSPVRWRYCAHKESGASTATGLREKPKNRESCLWVPWIYLPIASVPSAGAGPRRGGSASGAGGASVADFNSARKKRSFSRGRSILPLEFLGKTS